LACSKLLPVDLELGWKTLSAHAEQTEVQNQPISYETGKRNRQQETPEQRGRTGQERTIRRRGEPSHHGGRDEEDQEPTAGHRHAPGHSKQELAAAVDETPGWLA